LCYSKGLHQLTVTLAERRPVCLLIDDVQWTDVPTLRWLVYLLRKAAGSLPLMLVMSRTTGVYPIDSLIVTELVNHAERIKLGEFSAGDIAFLSERAWGITPAPGFILACTEVTGGNPFILSQLLTSMRHESARPDEQAARDLTRYGREELGASVLARLHRESPLSWSGSRGRSRCSSLCS
jgi:predicted ATPase